LQFRKFLFHLVLSESINTKFKFNILQPSTRTILSAVKVLRFRQNYDFNAEKKKTKINKSECFKRFVNAQAFKNAFKGKKEKVEGGGWGMYGQQNGRSRVAKSKIKKANFGEK